jgi:S-adenosylmethionine hydrolase
MLAADGVGVAAAHVLSDARYRLPEVSHTFHARDVFAPAAAHIAVGVPLEELGPRVDPDELVRLAVPEPDAGRSQLSTQVLVIDRFGNVSTNARRSHIDALGVQSGDRVEVRLTLDRYYATVAETIADAGVGELIFYEDSYGLMTLAISNGDAAGLTGVGIGDEIRIAVE